MSNKITIKRSAVPGKVPVPGDLEYGEFAINYADGNLFFKDSSNNIATLASTQFSNVTGNVTGGNVVSLGQISATGNITGNYFIGNGSLLTGISGGGSTDAALLTGNTLSSNVVSSSLTAVGNLSTLSVVGNVTAGNVSAANVAATTISATGNITSFVVNTTDVFASSISTTDFLTTNVAATTVNSTTLSATGNVNAGNAAIGGTVTAVTVSGTTLSATGNVNAANVTASYVNVPGGNIDAANVNTTFITAIGNVNAGNFGTTGIISAGGNVVSANINTGIITATTGNITDVNASMVSATGNVSAGNVISLGTISATGNATVGNVTTSIVNATVVSATGNITANYFVGNGSLLTGISVDATSIQNGNSNVQVLANSDVVVSVGGVANVAVFGTNTLDVAGNIEGGNLLITNDVEVLNLLRSSDISAVGNVIATNVNSFSVNTVDVVTETLTATVTVTPGSGNITGNIVNANTVIATGNITGNYFLGNGSQLTGIQAGAVTTFSSTAPVSPAQGDIWIDADTGIQYIYFDDGTSSQWAEMEAQTSIASGADLSSVAQDIVPSADVTYDLGSATHRWRDIYLSGNTINLGGATIKTDAASGAIALIPEPTESNPNPSGMVVSPSGGITVVSTVGGEVSGNAIAAAATAPTATPVPIDITTTAPQNGQALLWSTENAVFAPGNVSAGGTGVTVYGNISSLPLANVSTGAMAFVSSTNRLYLWNGTGWFNIALINTNPTITGGLESSYIFTTDGTPIELTLTASDPEGIPLTWSYEVTSGVLGNTATVSQADNVFTITPSTDTADAGVFEITFSASDGINLGTAASTFTLAFGAADPYYKQSVLLSTTATNNGTNNTFVDSSTNNFTVTRNGNATQGAFGPFSPAGWSGYFDGTGDYLSVPYSTSLFDWWTGDYTIEAWVYPTSFTGWSYSDGGNIKPILIGNKAYNTNEHYWGFGLNTSGSVYFAYYNGSSQGAGTSGAATLNAWNHIAVVVNGGTITVYLNGVGTVLGTVSGTPQSSASVPLTIGAGNNTYINGYVSNLRVVKGTAVYTTNFTPPEQPLTAVANTSLLTMQSNRFVDNSTNALAITRYGDTKVTPFSPFEPSSPYSTSVNGGSAYFDGTGDFLSVENNNALQIVDVANFTVEAWVYPTAFSGGAFGGTIVSKTNGSNGWIIRLQTDGQYAWVQPNVAAYPFGPTGAVALNVWHHIAIVKLNGAYKGYINGVGYSFSAANISETTSPVNIGFDGFGPFTGYISNVRIVKGTAIYTANFTPPTAPATAVANTSLLLNSANANIFDQTGKVDLETVGDAKTSTAVVKYGTTSMAFNGTTAYSTIPNSDLVNFGSGNFTVEAWIYPTAITGERGIVSLYGYTADRRSWYMALDGSTLRIRIGTVGTSSTVSNASASGTITANQWQHVAFVRNGNTVTGYINGVNVVSSAFSGTAFNNTVDPVVIGAVGPNFTGFFAGYISDVRITKGVARYTANFTPPTAQLGFYNPE